MLSTLRIKNLALVSDLTLELHKGCNAITGETGAGKSMLIGALNLVLGERADRSLIRSGEDSCTVEAVFDASALKDLNTFLEERGLEPCADGQLMLKRSIAATGTNRQFVNGSPTTLPVLSAIGEWLVDIHGPHEHQSLLNPAKQLAILDAFGALNDRRDAFAALLKQLKDLEEEKRALIVDERTYAQQLDLLRHQVNEISAARLDPAEEESLEADYNRAANAAKILENAQAALDTLSENDSSLMNQARVIGRSLSDLGKLDPQAAPLIESFEQALATLTELQGSISHYIDKVDLDPARLGELEERLNLVQSLKRKYGHTLADVIRFGEESAHKLQSLEQRDAELERINAALTVTRQKLVKAGLELSSERKKLLPQFTSKVRRQLEDLGFAQSRIDVALKTPSTQELATPDYPFVSSGLDAAEFQFAPNPGEPSKPLRMIASSGELARVMLALKTVLAAQDEVPVLVFDEVDANVGGQTAQAIGEKMRELGRRRQVLCITHSAHVAAPATAHFVVNKQVVDGRTISQVTLLDRKERANELARMLGGPLKPALKHAESLLESAPQKSVRS